MDRIDSERTYTVANVALVCTVINYMKHKLKCNQFFDLCRAIRDFDPSTVVRLQHCPSEARALFKKIGLRSRSTERKQSVEDIVTEEEFCELYKVHINAYGALC